QKFVDTILKSIVHHVQLKLEGGIEYEYYHALCELCSAISTPSKTLTRCTGCELVSYCSKKCIKEDKINHRDICKNFSVKNGKNIFTIGQEKRKMGKNWNKYLIDLHNQASEITKDSHQVDIRMFLGPRMCPICKETRSNMLKDCVCCCVAYCSEEHRLKDKEHLVSCEEMELCVQVYSYRQRRHLETVPVPSHIDHVYKPLPSMRDCTDPNSFLRNADVASILRDDWLTEKIAILSER
ncbi:unnamed protein product, partial [Meganyctiphanes norvegica]